MITWETKPTINNTQCSGWINGMAFYFRCRPKVMLLTIANEPIKNTKPIDIIISEHSRTFILNEFIEPVGFFISPEEIEKELLLFSKLPEQYYDERI